MTSENLRAGLIWATRGRTWGFRFLLDGGQADPLTTYERAFARLPDELTAMLNGIGIGQVEYTPFTNGIAVAHVGVKVG